MNYFSIPGKHHDYQSERNQDAVLFRQNERYCAIVLADGVSSCKNAKAGAEAACRFVTDYLMQHAERLFYMQERDIAYAILTQVLYYLKQIAEKNAADVEEYSSTLACVLFDMEQRRMLYFSVGDSLIAAVKDHLCYIIAMPADSRNGCCVTTTFNAVSMAKVGVMDTEGIASVMICSDGAWELMYRRSRMQQTIQEMILHQDFDKLKDTLLGKERYDDCSVINMNLDESLRRKPA